ncbi:MAG TPA: YCF48-related protein, partial [Bacteroidales bacterium]|nr:YCF48-related protein [Bacteroidales bacterium]
MWVLFTGGDNNGTIVGMNGRILHTSDGGAHWSVQSGNVQDWLTDVSFTNVNMGTAVGQKGLILYTTDA